MSKEEKIAKLESILEDDDKFNLVLKRSFNAVDKDKSGYLNVTEMESVIATFYQDLGLDPPGPGEAEEYIDMLDTGDKDGLISPQEFRPMLRGMLASLLSIVMAED
jgi:Ca2+-binding EF-hand superfamily protein